MIGLSTTQHRGKEKLGPKKTKLSRMKKTILRELMLRHGLLPGDAEAALAAAEEDAATAGERSAAQEETAGAPERAATATEGEAGEAEAAGADPEEGAPAQEGMTADELLSATFAQLYPEGEEEGEEEEGGEEEEEEVGGEEAGATAADGRAEGGDGGDGGEEGLGDEEDEEDEEGEEREEREAGGAVAPSGTGQAPAAAPAASAAASPAAAAAADGVAGGEAAAEEEGAKKGLVRPKEASSDPRMVREYVDQLILPEVNEAVARLLAELQRLQERAHLKDPVKAATRKRYVCGLREVLRALKMNKAKALVVSHNIEKIESEDGLDEMMEQIMRMCSYALEWVYNDEQKRSLQTEVPREKVVPIIFAFTRRVLSRSLKRSAKTSCVAVLSYDGAGELFEAVTKSAAAARAQFTELSHPWRERPPEVRHLVLRPMRGVMEGPSQAMVDPLLLGAQIRKVEWDEE